MNDRSELDRFLETDAADVGCDDAQRLPHVDAELVGHGRDPVERCPDIHRGIASHLSSCAQCGEDANRVLAKANTQDADQPESRPPVTVHWRPGCGFCRSLRRGLDRAGLDYTAVNIWEDRAAAARVRLVARGNETVPTVFVGDRAMVNPTAKQVLTAAGARSATGSTTATASRRATRRIAARDGRGQPFPTAWLSCVAWSVGLALLWLVLALNDPTTTYHLAPFLTTLAWPAVALWRQPQRLLPRRAAAVMVLGSVVLAITVTLGLAAAGLLKGPALVGPTPMIESLVMVGAGAVTAVLMLVSSELRHRLTEDGS